MAIIIVSVIICYVVFLGPLSIDNEHMKINEVYILYSKYILTPILCDIILAATNTNIFNISHIYFPNHK